MHRMKRVMTCAAVCTCTVATTLGAQDTPPSAWARGSDVNGASSSGSVSWLGAWSPLRPIVDLPRGLLRAPLAPGVLDAPSPMAGAFVLGGAPGALARDLMPRIAGDTSSFGELRFKSANESGVYHRPLDVTESHVTSVSGLGWSPVGARGIAIGRFVIDREYNAISSFAERLTPYVSSPFIATDSVRPPMQRTRARLEGALGLRLGEFGVGLSASLDSREHNSVDFPLRRTGRASTPAVMTGIERTLPWFGLRIGGYYRWSEPNETNLLNATPSATVIYGLQGYDEPFGYAVGSNSPVFVRVDRRATALGGSAELTVMRTRVVVMHEKGDRAEDQYRSITSAVRPTETWRASGSESRAMAQRLFGTRVRATVVASIESLDGDAVRSDLKGIAVKGSDEKSAIEGDVRVSFAKAWSAAVIGGATHVLTTRTDYVAAIGSHIDATTPFGGVELARKVGRASVAVGATASATSPSGALPSSARDPNYRRLIAPALAYDAASARAWSTWFTATTPMSAAVLLVSVRAEHTSPTAVVTSRLQPGGERTAWSVTVGLRP